jgi:uncharacterized protein
MPMHAISPLPALLGGALIGLAASLFFLSHGRTAGISGLWAGLLKPAAASRATRLWFFVGLVGVGLLVRLVHPSALGSSPAPIGVLATAGLLVGYGTQLGGGCTSGHGVCGISRFDLRSIVATVTFMLTGALAVYAFRVL